MKILYFSYDYGPHDHRFLSAIRDGGHEAFHVRLEGGQRQTEDRPVPVGVEIVRWAGGKAKFRWSDVPRLVMSFRGVIGRIKPDLVHAGPIPTCALIAVLAGFRPVLTMSWGFDLMQDVHKSRWMERITQYVLRNSTFFTSDAHVTRDKAVAYGMNPDRTVVFPWGVDLARFTPKDWSSTNQEKLITDHSFTLFCNRSWEPRYGVDVLARAFVLAAGSRPGLSLMLLGGGSQGARIRQILMHGGVLDRVTFAGQVSQSRLPNWYHKADVYISPSHVDGSSVSLMEALACGLPCLVSDIPANKEWVTEGENGWLFPDGDADALAEKILQTIDQREKLPDVGRKARAVAEDRADWVKNSKKLMQVYERILQSRKGSERRILMVFALTVALLMALLMVFFALENPAMVTVSLFGYAVQGSLALIVLVAMGMGVLIGVLVMLPGRIKIGLANARKRKQIGSLESSLEEHKTRLAEMDKHPDPNSLPDHEKPEEN